MPCLQISCNKINDKSLFCIKLILLYILLHVLCILFYCLLQQEDSGPSLLAGLLPATEELEANDDVNSQGHGGGTFPSPAAPEGSAGSSGWRYVSWLPSFSVEQSHTQLPRHHQPISQPASTSQLDNLARQVFGYKIFLFFK